MAHDKSEIKSSPMDMRLKIRTALGDYYATWMGPNAKDSAYWATPLASMVAGTYAPLRVVDFSNIPHVVEHQQVIIAVRDSEQVAQLEPVPLAPQETRRW